MANVNTRRIYELKFTDPFGTAVVLVASKRKSLSFGTVLQEYRKLSGDTRRVSSNYLAEPFFVSSAVPLYLLD